MDEVIDEYEPDWFVKSLEESIINGFYSSSEYFEVMKVINALDESNLKPLADYIAENGVMHPFIRRHIYFLICGNVEQSGALRLDIKTHPDHKGYNKTGRIGRNRKRNKELDIAYFVRSQGGLKPGQNEAAVVEAMNKYHLSRSQIFAIWGKYKDDVKPIY